jgi:RNA polymerase sigma factor (sigma-70 family)
MRGCSHIARVGPARTADTLASVPDIFEVMPGSDTDSFRTLYEENYERIAAYVLRRTQSAEDAADAVAETFLTAWRRLDDLPQGEQATMWLYVTARRVVANQRRSTERRLRLLDRIRQQPRREPEDLDDAGVAAEALSRLRVDDQEILGLIAWDGLAYRQVGAVLGCSENAAKLRAARARQRFASKFETLRGPIATPGDVTAQPECATHAGEAHE